MWVEALEPQQAHLEATPLLSALGSSKGHALRPWLLPSAPGSVWTVLARNAGGQARFGQHCAYYSPVNLPVRGSLPALQDPSLGTASPCSAPLDCPLGLRDGPLDAKLPNHVCTREPREFQQVRRGFLMGLSQT